MAARATASKSGPATSLGPPPPHEHAAAWAPCALREADSQGRRYAEPAHPYRGEFQRDRDRVIHARAFRRLENKTQVFSRRYSDHFRTRLTHTLEVAQVSRTVAQALGLNSDLMEALALAHDLGHPPFGHAGEFELDQIMRAYGERFDHNLQALRIVEAFEVRYAAFPGLNLTFEVREGLVKHSHDYRPEEHPELASYQLDQRPPLEAQLIDLTDEICYSSADLDDGFEAHLLDLEGIAAEVPVFAEALAQVDRQFGPIAAKLRFNEALKRLLDRFVSDLIAELGARMQAYDSALAIRCHPQRLAAFSPPVEAERQALKAFLYRKLYHHPQLLRENERARQMVRAVFDHFLRHPEALPAAYQEKMKTALPPRVICDYLAGMTDSFITGLHRTL